uniref:Uncharacterized protein n=1 Tax=Glossina morsitans morsitans TaxID=37546 RepID=A0A1B0FEF8_GLOMM
MGWSRFRSKDKINNKVKIENTKQNSCAFEHVMRDKELVSTVKSSSTERNKLRRTFVDRYVILLEISEHINSTKYEIERVICSREQENPFYFCLCIFLLNAGGS